MMESLQLFNKGMDKDTNNLQKVKGVYEDAQNLRIVNDVDSTSFSINNVKGNELNISIPDTTTFQKITIIADSGGATQNLSINGQIGAPFNTGGMNAQELYEYINSDPAYTSLGTQYNIYYNNAYLVLVPVSGFTVSVTTNNAANISIDSNFIPAQTNLEIIGSVNIRDDIYLFTTSNTTKNPGGHSFDPTLPVDSSSVGQIWKYTYNKITSVGSLELKYNNYLDFSTYYAIAPTAATGRYENSTTQRIYWTDNFNKPKSLNVADSNCIATDISLLDLLPSVDFDIPILQSIYNSGGSIEVGAYQVAYRLKNTGGAVTNFSPLSNTVYVVTANEAVNVLGGGFKDYIGAVSGSLVAKQITWKIENLDIDYERIEIVVAKRE